MKELARVRHLLIDLDGTLLGAHDLPLTLDFLRQTLGAFRPYGGLIKALRAIRILKDELLSGRNPRALTNDHRAFEIFSQAIGLPLKEAQELLAKTVPSIFPKLQKHFYPIHEAALFLAWAEEAFGRESLTLATNPVWPLELVKLRMQWGEINPDLFGMITHSGIMHSTKPHAEYYREILKLLQLDPDECALIGNEMKNDLPATRVGIPVFIVSRGRKLQKLPKRGHAASAWRGSFLAIQESLSRTLKERAEAETIG